MLVRKEIKIRMGADGNRNMNSRGEPRAHTLLVGGLGGGLWFDSDALSVDSFTCDKYRYYCYYYLVGARSMPNALVYPSPWPSDLVPVCVGR